MNKNVIGVRQDRYLGLVKREAGVSPARTRRCKRGAVFPQVSVNRASHWGIIPGKMKNSVDT